MAEMEKTITIKSKGAELAMTAELVEAAREFATNGRAEGTRRAYARDWRTFVEWCEAHGFEPLPATGDVVALFLADRAKAGRKVAKIARELAAITEAHRAKNIPSPRGTAAVRAVWAGIRRTLGVAQRQVDPLVPEQLKAIIASLPSGLLGLRDRAILVLGFSAAMRRSEIVALDVTDLKAVPDGLEITVRRGKTDQIGAGRRVGVPYSASLATCPVRAVAAWLEAACITDGPLFTVIGRGGKVGTQRLTDKAVARLVKRSAARAGIDPQKVSGHSLRAGFATSAAKAGKSERAIASQTGHRSMAVLRRYIRDGSLFTENAAAGLL